ncbi:MAG: GMC family oxidoreductase [Rhodobacteraceae bacterium]|nr:MAG: GMC family oxidoreductase [Paracoccaceae bacterium]
MGGGAPPRMARAARRARLGARRRRPLMLIPFDAIAELSTPDVCVIGTGPAGVTLALDLADHGRRVLLCEGGGFDFDERAQEIYRGELLGDPYRDLDIVRLRAFGGASGLWGGVTRPLDADDFADKPHHPLARWPIVKADLDPYLASALVMLEVDPLPADEPVADSGFQRIHFGESPPTRFGETYRAAVLDHPNIFLCLNANATEVRADDARATGIALADFDGGRATAVAGAYVIACGGIENSRLLLWSNETSNGRVVRRADALGRYWMEHPHFTVGDFVADRAFAHVHYSLTPDRRRALGLLNCGLRFFHRADWPRDDLLDDLAVAAPETAARLRARGDGLSAGRLRAAWEQEPRAESRVLLSTGAVDRFGAPRAALKWLKSPEDLVTVRRTASAFGDFMARAGVGRLRLRDWVLGEGDFPEDDELGGNHHMGGTRMAEDPALGVVDANLRVHGQPNLYVLGSSVFPSGGHANPTLTIVQLAHRLADHLAERRG